MFARFRLPTSLPYLFSGLKVAATLAIAGTVVGEFVGADKGLGYLLLVTNSNMETALMFATIVALTIIGLVFYYLGGIAGELPDPVARHPSGRRSRHHVAPYASSASTIKKELRPRRRRQITGEETTMKRQRDHTALLMAAAAAMTLTAPAGAQTLDKFPFRLNWTLYGEHAPFFVALRQGLLQGSRPRRRNPRRQRLDHGGAIDRQRHQPGRPMSMRRP